ncbi:MAG: hypothetical protein GY833_22705 [Aestuariibacter sp.]|nr:hypothetical protein [Aestuariibacter sp.]
MYSCYYLTTGAKGSRYSLRHQFEETVVLTNNFGEKSEKVLLRDVHVRALSTCHVRAVEIVTKLGHLISEPKHTLTENGRRRLENEAKRIKSYNETRVHRVAARSAEQNSYLAKGLYPFGKDKGTPIKECVAKNDQGWFEFWLKKGKEEPQSTAGQLAEYLREHFPEKLKVSQLNIEGNGEFFGDEGDKLRRIAVTVADKYSFNGHYGWTNVILFVTRSGELLKYMGSSDLGGEIAKGNQLTLDFVIKKHDEYKGIRQTVIKNVKVK